jgi:N-acetylglucosaminyldiphosphoundecaprenol N-acetyl-beta-D-mannosaminyltransferase
MIGMSQQIPGVSIPDRMARAPDVSTARLQLRWPPKVDLFGVGVSLTDYDEATATILHAARQGQGGVVSCHAVHALITAAGDSSLRAKVNTFELVCPDGQPVRWAMNVLRGAHLSDRVYGPDLMLRLCRGAADAGIAIYLYGGTPFVVKRLEANLRHLCPKLKIAGREAPPFRSLIPEEDGAMVERINRSGAGLMFIGLGCPKQDLFGYEHRHLLGAVQVCVGAAFDFHAGVKKMAPSWMQRHGLEWLYRLSQEPGRLWRRYLITNSIFLTKLGISLCVRAGGGSSERHHPLRAPRARTQKQPRT